MAGLLAGTGEEDEVLGLDETLMAVQRYANRSAVDVEALLRQYVAQGIAASCGENKRKREQENEDKKAQAKGGLKKTSHFLAGSALVYDFELCGLLGSPPRVTNWRKALDAYVQEGDARPKYCTQRILCEDDLVVCMYDPYPKSKIHLLVLPKLKLCLPGDFRKLTKEHVPALRQLQSATIRIKERLRQSLGECDLQEGFHSIPSMAYMHVHIISLDFSGVRNKRHYLSFTTPFFIPIDKMVREIESSGNCHHLRPDQKSKVLSGPLVCCHCHAELKSVPKLKEHLATHDSQTIPTCAIDAGSTRS